MTPRAAIGIVDPCCAVPYAPGLDDADGIGGTEATVARIVAALSSDHAFALFQKPCEQSDRVAHVTRHPLAEAYAPDAAAAFLVVNSWKVACRLRRFHPGRPIALWLHVHPGRHNRRMGAALTEAGIDVICVSRSHADSFRDFLSPGPLPRLAHIHNPVADDLHPDATPRDPNRLLFASSPHKGLQQVFGQFAALRTHLPDLVLHVADPGYLKWDTGPVPAGVRFLGRLDHPALLAQMRRSLCLFYPQTTFAETFGLVIAEANAVGTPALLHRGLGANDEVASGPAQLVDGHRTDLLLERVRTWRATPPEVRMRDDFRLASVTRRWRDVMGAMLTDGRKAGVD